MQTGPLTVRSKHTAVAWMLLDFVMTLRTIDEDDALIFVHELRQHRFAMRTRDHVDDRHRQKVLHVLCGIKRAAHFVRRNGASHAAYPSPES